MITARVLTSVDKDSLAELINLRPQTFNGYSDEQFESVITTLVDEWFDSPLCFMVGMFDDDLLIGALVAIESQHSPSWTWAYWISRPGIKVETFVHGEGLAAFKHADQLLFEEMETARGLNRFFVSYPVKGTGLKGTGMSPRLFQIMQRHGFRVSRYHFITDCIVPAGEAAKYSYQQAIQGNRLWPVDTEIRMGVLIQS